MSQADTTRDSYKLWLSVPAAATAMVAASAFLPSFVGKKLRYGALLMLAVFLLAILAKPAAGFIAIVRWWVVPRLVSAFRGFRFASLYRFERIYEYVDGRASRDELKGFLKGFCFQYLTTTRTREVAEHFLLALTLNKRHIQLKLTHLVDSYKLTVVTFNRPGLAADILRVLTNEYKMNIVACRAFVNSAGAAVGTFQFRCTNGRGPARIQHLLGRIHDCVSGHSPARLSECARPFLKHQDQMRFQTQVRFDDCHSRCTTRLEIKSPDRHALLFEIVLVLAKTGCDIKAAMAATEDSNAVDIFFVTKRGEKIDAMTRSNLEEILRTL
jgi:UTP:GlnB (protein PII) uridylyltransferase